MKNNKKNSLLESQDRNHCFFVPEGYFEQLHEAILTKIESEATLEVPPLPFELPASYFDSMAASIEERIKSETNPLDNLTKESIYTVPEDYFKELPFEIQSKLNETKLRKLGDRNTTVRRIAIAATTLLALLASGALLFQLNTVKTTTPIAYSTPTQAEVTGLIARLDKRAIKHYLETQEHEEIIVEAALKSDKNIQAEIQKEIPMDASEKKQMQEEIELLNIEELELDMEL